ncbi:MAG: radical SAM protein, partial [Chloroflexi bacterium]|nr:radical SAM protein [Chloroflexota bacterium]
PIEPEVLLANFDPARFLIKITPLNPTYQAVSTGLRSYVDPTKVMDSYPIVEAIREAGYQVILSIGEQEENLIGSNCGQYVQKHILETGGLSAGYSYQVVQPTAKPE